MLATKQYAGPFWQGIFLTAAFCLLSFDSAKAVTEQPVDYSPAELEELVGPVALYPDDLIGIILPASTYPLQIVEAARYLEQHEKIPTLEPDEDWDDAVVALLNYPEVIELLNEDLDWTWNLGEAVVNQQADVLDAIQDFRGRAVAAGNLESDDRQTVTYVDEVIEVTPVDPEVIYVPYYEPSTVVVYQRWPVYHYYPRPYPVYYYPYPAHYSFASGFFWGVTTAYTIGWLTDRVHFHYYGYASHPYYGHYYPTHYYSRHAWRARHYNHAKPRSHYVYNKHQYGNTWKPQRRHGDRPRHRSADRHQASASNFTSSTRGSRASGDMRGQSRGERQTSTSFRSGQDSERNSRTRQTRSSDGRRQVDDSATNTRGTVANNSGNRNRSRQTRGGDGRRQIDSTGKDSRVAGTRNSGNRNGSRGNRNVQSRSGSNQIIDARTDGRTSAKSTTKKPRRAGESANTRQRTARETRDDNSVRVTRNATRVTGSTATPKRAQPRTQPRKIQRQARRAPQSNKRSASATRTANASKSKPAKRSATRVASAPRGSGGGSRSRSVGASTRRGHRR